MMMNVVSWNVNGIRAIEKKGFIDILNNFNADVVCIQETKANPTQLSQELLAPLCSQDNKTWYTYWSSAKKLGYSGTAIFC